MIAVDDTRRPDPAPPAFNLAEYVLFSNGADPDRIALSVVSAGAAERWSYDRLRRAVASAASGLLAAGLKPGDRLMLRLDHTPRFPVAFLGAAWAGILPVPTHAALTADELDRIADTVEPVATLADPDVRCPTREMRVLPSAILDHAHTIDRATLGAPGRPAYILCTSGTSGRPKPVVHAHEAIWARRRMLAGWTGMTSDDRVLHAGAFNWSYTLGTGLLDPWALGASALVLAKGTDPSLIPLLARRHDATILAGVPGTFRKLLAGQMPAMPKLRHVLSAGEKLPEATRTAWQSATGTDIHEAFGQTECSTFISGSPGRPAPPGTLGYAQPGRAVAILKDGRPVRRGEIGQIAVASDDPGLALSVRIDGVDWVETGDLGEMSADGAITYHGRSDDVLTAGGYRMSPVEIENAYLALPGIDTAAAADLRLDAERTVVALWYTGPAPLPDSTLEQHGSSALAPHKVPRVFRHVPHLPSGPHGKLLRRALHAEKDPPS